MTNAMTVEPVVRLPIDERLAVIADIWETIVAEEAVLPVSDELGAEFNRRLAEHTAHPESAREWYSIRNEV